MCVFWGGVGGGGITNPPQWPDHDCVCVCGERRGEGGGRRRRYEPAEEGPEVDDDNRHVVGGAVVER